eukprot:72440_1
MCFTMFHKKIPQQHVLKRKKVFALHQLLLLVVILLRLHTSEGIESQENICDSHALGCDTLATFLFDHKTILKKSVNPIYNILQDIDIDYHELLRFSTTDVRDILTEYKLTKLHIGRLINLLRTMPQSQIYKESNKIILTKEEEIIIESLNTQNISINSEINHINNKLNKLKQNCSVWR